jgi:hypothetical protein
MNVGILLFIVHNARMILIIKCMTNNIVAKNDLFINTFFYYTAIVKKIEHSKIMNRTKKSSILKNVVYKNTVT